MVSGDLGQVAAALQAYRALQLVTWLWGAIRECDRELSTYQRAHPGRQVAPNGRGEETGMTREWWMVVFFVALLNLIGVIYE